MAQLLTISQKVVLVSLASKSAPGKWFASISLIVKRETRERVNKVWIMRKRKRSLKYLFLSIVSLPALIALIYFFSPAKYLSVFSFQFSVFSLLFPLLFIFIFSITTYISKSPNHGILLGLFAISALLFRWNNLAHPFFFLLLAALFLVLELLFAYKK